MTFVKGKKKTRHIRKKLDSADDDDDTTPTATTVVNAAKGGIVTSTANPALDGDGDAVMTGDNQENIGEKKKKKKKKKKDNKPPSTLLSFDDDAGETPEEFKVKKKVAVNPAVALKQPGDEGVSDLAPGQTAHTQVSSTGAYTAEALASLRAQTKSLGGSSRISATGNTGSVGERGKHRRHKKGGDSASPNHTMAARIASGDDGSSLDDDAAAGDDAPFPSEDAVRAAREKRERLRQGADYIPLNEDTDDPDLQVAHRRLVRDEDDDEEDNLYGHEGRRDGVTNMNAFMKGGEKGEGRFYDAVEEKGSDDDDDDGAGGDGHMTAWEREAIRRNQPSAGRGSRAGVVPGDSGDGRDPYTSSMHGQLPDTSAMPLPSVASVQARLQTQLQELNIRQGNDDSTLKEIEANIALAQGAVVSNTKDSGEAEDRFTFLQEMREYVTDLLGCLDAKNPILDAMYERLSEIRRVEYERLKQRRAGDERDLKREFESSVLGIKHDDDQPDLDDFGRDRSLVLRGARDKRERARQARLARHAERRQHAQASGTVDTRPTGWSTDDNSDTADRDERMNEIDDVLADATDLFADTLPEFRELAQVKTRFEEWKYQYPKQYREGYVAESLVSILKPFVMRDLLAWTPIQSPSEIATMPWHDIMFDYGLRAPTTSASATRDPTAPQGHHDADEDLVPNLVAAAVVPTFLQACQEQWDLYSRRENENAVATMAQIQDYLQGKPAYNSLCDSIITLFNDNMPAIPILPAPSQGTYPFLVYQFNRATCLLSRLSMWESCAPSQVRRAVGQTIATNIIPYLQQITDTDILYQRLSTLGQALPAQVAQSEEMLPLRLMIQNKLQSVVGQQGMYMKLNILSTRFGPPL